MTKKLTIGAAVMALPALVLVTGPASAQPESGDAGVSQSGDVVINEIGAELNNAGSNGDIDGGFIELRNDTDDAYNLSNHMINMCDAAGSPDIVVQFQTGDFIPANSTYLIADANFNNPTGDVPDKFFISGVVLQAAGGVELVDGITPVDDVKWGSPHVDCAFFLDAGVTPDGAHSIQPNPTPPPAWCRAVPTPGGANGPCVL